jgi:hypothetical protein
VGSLLNSTSPPPFTCTSMKPGASHAPSGISSTGSEAGTSRRSIRPVMRGPSSVTAWPSQTTSPSKMKSAAIACGAAFIESG